MNSYHKLEKALSDIETVEAILDDVSRTIIREKVGYSLLTETNRTRDILSRSKRYIISAMSDQDS